MFNLLERIMYNRRSKNNPFWNTLVISGYVESEERPFLGQIDSQVWLLEIIFLRIISFPELDSLAQSWKMNFFLPTPGLVLLNRI